MGRMRIAWMTTSEPVVADHGDHLEEVPGSVRAEIEDLGAVVFLGFDHRVLDRMRDVVVSDPVLPG